MPHNAWPLTVPADLAQHLPDNTNRFAPPTVLRRRAGQHGRRKPMDRDELADRVFAIVIGAGVGDAMGAPTEGLEAGEIDRRYGWVADFTGTGTDDSLMAALLVEALVSSGGRAGADEWAKQLAAGRAGGYRDFADGYHAAVRQPVACDSRETVPAAAGLACLAGGDPRTAVEYGANFGRDTDTIATMAGAMCGAVSRGPLPDAWLRQLGDPALRAARDTADRLAATARTEAARLLADVTSVAGLTTERNSKQGLDESRNDGAI
jgi:ADP-ribosylglycohydrolase